MKGDIAKANRKNVVELVREGKNFNFKTKTGHIYQIGGMLCKTENGQAFMFDLNSKTWKQI